MPGWIGPWEIAILLIVVLLVFGPKRLPEMGRSLGRGMREFKDSLTGKHKDEDEDKPAAELPVGEPEPEAEKETVSASSGERDS